MKNVLKFFGFIFLFGIVLFNNFLDIKNIFSSKNQDIVWCVEFKTKVDNIRMLISDINTYRENERKSLNLECSKTTVTIVNSSFDNPPEPSIVWSLYLDYKKLNRSELGIENFTNKFFLGSIGEKNVERIISNIRGWLDDPRMDSETRNLILKSLNT